MKKNLLQTINRSKDSDEFQLGLDMTDIQYIRSVTAYAVNQGCGTEWRQKSSEKT